MWGGKCSGLGGTLWNPGGKQQLQVPLKKIKVLDIGSLFPRQVGLEGSISHRATLTESAFLTILGVGGEWTIPSACFQVLIPRKASPLPILFCLFFGARVISRAGVSISGSFAPFSLHPYPQHPHPRPNEPKPSCPPPELGSSEPPSPDSLRRPWFSAQDAGENVSKYPWLPG